MTMKKLMFALIALSGVAAFAQAPLGTVSNVEGVVTATQGSSVVTVTPGAQIQNGMRFITTSSGSVTLRLANGCTVTVPPNHGVTVVQTMTCPQLTAAVQPVTPVAAQSTFLPSSAVVNGAIALGAIGILIGAEEDFRHDDNERPISAR